MPRQEKRSQSETQPELLRPSHEQDRIDNALQIMSTRLGKPLNEERINQWHRDLANYPVEAIEWALDVHSRNARTLPALSDLIVLLRTWHFENDLTEKCPSECQQRHGKGYHWNDVLLLWKMRGSSSRAWSESDYDTALMEVDRTRQDGPPEWRA